MGPLLRFPNYYKKNYVFFFTLYMSWKNNFRRQKYQKSDFYQKKKLFKIDDIDAYKILVSRKEPYRTDRSIKYFIRYNDDDVIRSLCISLPQMIRYVKCFDSNKTMSFVATDNKLFEKYTKIWEKLEI